MILLGGMLIIIKKEKYDPFLKEFKVNDYLLKLYSNLLKNHKHQV